MCRMVGVVAERPVAMRALLRDGLRNLSALSVEHPDGWGVATKHGDGWRIDKGTGCAAECGRYRATAERIEATLAIAHVRKKTVGGTSLVNTHPFRRGPFVLAHNGTIDEAGALRGATDPAHVATVAGQTDSEQLLAFLTTRIERAGEVVAGLLDGIRMLGQLGGRAAATFLFSDGERLFAYRQGRSLYALARDRGSRTRAVAIASEPLTGEDWRELPERGLYSVTRAATTPVVRLDQG